jgi:stage II sporulation protein B
LDKPNKGQISIKLNGEKQNFVEGGSKIYPETSIDPYSKENLIDSSDIEKESLQEIAAGQEAVEESFDWIIPETTVNDIEEYKIVSGKNASKKQPSFLKNNKKKNGGVYGSIIIPGIFAILIGTTFGFFMLKLVLTQHSNKSITEPTAVEQQGTKQATTSKASAVVKTFSTYVVQEGVYTTKESAADAETKVVALGIPAKAIQVDGKEYLFLGTADAQDMAKQMGSFYKDKGIKGFYAKPLTFEEKIVSNLNDNEKTFLEVTPSIYQTLSNMTSTGLMTKKFSEDKTKEIDVLVAAGGIKNEVISKLRLELFAAEEKVKNYQKTKQAKDLTEAQQHLLNFLSQYNTLK